MVTAETTEQTLQELRRNALSLLEEKLTQLAQKLSLSRFLQVVPEAFTQEINDIASRLGEAGQDALERNAEEPWRQFINLILVRLPNSDDKPDIYATASMAKKTGGEAVVEALIAHATFVVYI